MRTRSKSRTAQPPRIPRKKKSEIDRILEEAEAHLKPRVKDKMEKLYPDINVSSQYEKEETISLGEKRDLLLSLANSIESSLTALKILLGSQPEISLASTEIFTLLSKWRDYNEI